jgi:hypothetical protein
MNPLKWLEEGTPKLNVEWYAKGGIFDKPTLFNTPYGLKGVGEAGPEVVAPLSSLKEMLGLNNSSDNDWIVELIDAIVQLASRPIAINGKEIARQTVDDMSILLNTKNKSGARKVGVLR